MKNSFYFCMIALMLISLYSCDKVDPPYIENNGANTDTSQHVRKILLEDYTGHNCPNCPEAGIIAEDIKEMYGNKVVLLTVHAGWFANPACSVGGGYLPITFQINAGYELDTYFGISALGNPNGMVNRIEVGGSQIIGHTNWSSIVSTIVNKPPDAYIDITNNYHAGTNTLDIEVKSEFVHDTAGIFKLSVFIKGDSTSWQQIPTGVDPVYHHRNVLCKAVNVDEAWGDTLATGFIPAGTSVTKNYYSIALPAWNVNNCYVVAYIYDAASKTIIQAEEKKIK